MALGRKLDSGLKGSVEGCQDENSGQLGNSKHQSSSLIDSRRQDLTQMPCLRIQSDQSPGGLSLMPVPLIVHFRSVP